MECAPFLYPKDGYINNQAHKSSMNDNLKHVVFILTLLNGAMLHGCLKLMMGMKELA